MSKASRINPRAIFQPGRFISVRDPGSTGVDVWYTTGKVCWDNLAGALAKGQVAQSGEVR
jgi:hypothetical protein